MISRLMLGVAVLGTVSSTIFLGLVLLGARKWHQQARRDREANQRADDEALPPVSILKPLHGLEAQLAANLESFFDQDYPQYEVIFAVASEVDPARAVAQAVCERHPETPSRVLVTGHSPWPNRPAYAFARMTEVARTAIFVTSDSDVVVDRGYLRAVVRPVLQENTGMLTCLYRGLNMGGFSSLLDSIGMSVEMTAGVLVANLLEGIKFGLGPTIVVRREALDAIGGFSVLGDYLPNDFILGSLIAERGFTIALSSYVIAHVAPPMSISQMWNRHLRWTMGTRYSRPKGHLGSGLMYATPYGILGLLAGAGSGMLPLGVGLFGWSILNRLIEAYVVGWQVTRDAECRRRPWLYPLRDLLGFCAWVGSYLRRGFEWRSTKYELIKGGRMVPRRVA